MVKALSIKGSYHKQALGLCSGRGGGEEVGENNLCPGRRLRYNEKEEITIYRITPYSLVKAAASLMCWGPVTAQGAPFVFLLFWLAALSDEKGDNVSAVLAVCPEGFRPVKDMGRVMASTPQVCIFKNHFGSFWCMCGPSGAVAEPWLWVKLGTCPL